MASEISTDLPYQPLEPIKIEQEPCPLVCKTCSVFFNVIALAIFGIASGIAIATLAAASILTGGLIGGVAGVALGIALSILQKRASPEAKYRVQTLDQLEKTQTASEVLAAIQKIKGIVRENQITFKQANDNHALHAHVTVVTDALRDARPDIKKVWKTFLEHMDGHISAYPASHAVRLDFSLELARLEGRTANFTIEAFNPRNSADLAAFVELELECFGDGGIFSAERVKALITHGYVARSDADRSILGLLWTAPEGPGSSVQSIMGMGRKAGACRLNIGELLMRELIEKQAGTEFVLQVRESNTPALRLYQRLGFEQVRRISEYYNSPTEDGFLMSLNRAKYQPLEDIA